MSYAGDEDGEQPPEVCPACGGNGYRGGVVPSPLPNADALHPMGRCTCAGEMLPSCRYCWRTCPACLGTGTSSSPL